jgi:hypothetical protein
LVDPKQAESSEIKNAKIVGENINAKDIINNEFVPEKQRVNDKYKLSRD